MVGLIIFEVIIPPVHSTEARTWLYIRKEQTYNNVVQVNVMVFHPLEDQDQKGI